jgi:hypothetical protein
VSRREYTKTIELMVRTWTPRVNEAALAFEARWTRSALRSYDAKLADAFELALAQYDSVVVSGSSTEIDDAGARLVRAYGVITARLGAARVPDDAYMIGEHPPTKTQIIIASSPAAAKHAQANGYQFAKWFSPDEIATIIGLDARAKKIADVKAFFPGAEMIGVTHDGDADQE